MKTNKSFIFSIAVHLVLLGGVMAFFMMPKEEKEEEIVLELALNTPQEKPSEIKTPSKPHEIPHVQQQVPKQPSPTQPSPLPIAATAKVIEPIAQPIKTQPQAVVSNTPEPQKSEPNVVKKSEPIAVPTPPSPAPKPSAQEEYLENHLSAIRDLLIKYRKYPTMAVRLKQEGSVRVSFRLKENGSVEDVRIVNSSGFEILDQDAIALIEKTALYFPKPPKPVRITVPLKYSLKTAA